MFFKPKIVKFQNGQFGIRQWQPLLGYAFLDLQESRNSWWYGKEYIAKYCAADEATVREKFHVYKTSKGNKEIPGYDEGTPV